jgi:nucleotide-binding universal stress UspA family protein
VVVKAADRLTDRPGFLFASTDQHLLRKCPCPVWLRTSGARPEPQTVLAAVDVDDWDASEPETLADLNRRVVETGLRLIGEAGAVHVLHAWEAAGEGLVWTFASGPDPSAVAADYVHEVEAARGRSLAALMRSFTAQGTAGGKRLTECLVRGPARRAIAQQAHALGADVIVMGTVARTGLSGVIIGNTAEDILNSVDCSVLAVKPRSFVTPLSIETRTAD